MRETPLVSIVVATYRSRHDHLGVALRSALAQEDADIEVLVCDDSPDDGLDTFVAGFADPRLRYHHHRPALGVAANHGWAFARARGEFIAVLNHDDWLAPQFVHELAGALRREPAAVLAFCDHWVIDEAGRRLDDETTRSSATWGRTGLAPGLHRPCAELVVRQTLPIAMGTLFRRAALPALPALAGPAYDLWLSYLLCRDGAGVVYVPQRLSAWRTHADNLTSQAGLPWLLGSASCWHAMARDPLFTAHARGVQRKAAQAWVGCAQRAWAAGRRADTLRYGARSLANRVSLRGLLACLLPLLPARLARLAPARWAARGQASSLPVSSS